MYCKNFCYTLGCFGFVLLNFYKYFCLFFSKIFFFFLAVDNVKELNKNKPAARAAYRDRTENVLLYLGEHYPETCKNNQDISTIHTLSLFMGMKFIYIFGQVTQQITPISVHLLGTHKQIYSKGVLIGSWTPAVLTEGEKGGGSCITDTE